MNLEHLCLPVWKASYWSRASKIAFPLLIVMSPKYGEQLTACPEKLSLDSLASFEIQLKSPPAGNFREDSRPDLFQPT